MAGFGLVGIYFSISELSQSIGGMGINYKIAFGDCIFQLLVRIQAALIQGMRRISDPVRMGVLSWA